MKINGLINLEQPIGYEIIVQNIKTQNHKVKTKSVPEK
jgi:hypothetical protein